MKRFKDLSLGDIAVRFIAGGLIALLVAAVLFGIFIGIMLVTRPSAAATDPADAPPLRQAVDGAVMCEPIAVVKQTSVYFGDVMDVSHPAFARAIVAASWRVGGRDRVPLADQSIIVAFPSGAVAVWAARGGTACAVIVLAPWDFKRATEIVKALASP